jgi:hypothetical protein
MIEFRLVAPRLVGSICLIFVPLLGACNKPKASSASAAEVQKAFDSTRSDIKEFAQQGVAAEAKNDYGTAFVHYRALSLNPDLTPEQRNMADQAMLEMGKKLREASTNGDANAEKVLQMYRATK